MYNLEVEGTHTYFVGAVEWGFDVWVHNGCEDVAGNIVKNAKAGLRRHKNFNKELRSQNPGAVIQTERYLRGADGKSLRDPLTGERRRIDTVMLKDGKALGLYEVTSMLASKRDQINKEGRIREAFERVFIRDKITKNLVDVTDMFTQTIRRK